MNKKIKIILVAGARPNFMKIAPMMHEMKKSSILMPLLVHTGQHYDERMSDLFFKQLDIPEPDINLGVGSASHAVQTARILERFEKVCLEEKPNAVLVVGDVNSTAAAVLTASKLGITTIHYEAGLRSFDRTMPEEINRVVTDSICDLFFTTSSDADENLIMEGKKKKQIFMVGNLMIDSLVKNRKKSEEINVQIVDNSGNKYQPGKELKKGEFGVATFHRPNNVDFKDDLQYLLETLGKLSEKVTVVFPVHPRTQQNIDELGLDRIVKNFPNLILCKPLGYLDFLKLVTLSRFVLTDSGGIQEETTYLGIPCLTVRPNTERPVTITKGTNKLVALENIFKNVEKILKGKIKEGKIPKFWDGKSAERIVLILENVLRQKKTVK